MIGDTMSVLRSIEGQYAARGDVPFEELVAEFGVRDDEALAELIEADGRARLMLGRTVGLERYLRSIPDLEGRELPLDAAIDVSLRSLSASSRPTAEAVRLLIEKYPHLEASVREAATLAQALWSTTGLRAKVEAPVRSLPAEFGPRLGSGRRYELRRLLGRGGWGEVYLATDRQLSDREHEAQVAIKVLTGGLRGPWVRQRLIDEATKARRVAHSGVVRVLDRGVSDDDEDYIVYEFVEGGELGDWLQGRAMPAREAALLVAKVARGVQAAHSAGLVHCDLKPGNILVTSRGEPKVADFGIAVRRGEGIEAVREHDDGRPVGNIAFISPEQFRMEEGSLSIASDIYALGGILFFLITHEFPNGGTVKEIERNHDPLDGRKLPPLPAALGVDADLQAVCRRAMALRPIDRYPSAAALADDLEAWAAREPIYWLRRGPVRRLSLWCRRRPAVAIASGLALAAVVLGTGASLYWARMATLKAAEVTVAANRLSSGLSRYKVLYEHDSDWSHGGLSQDMMPLAVMLEWANGGALLGDPADPAHQWESRVDTIRKLVLDRQQHGLGDSYETLGWQSMLGLWLLNARQHEEAERVINDNIERLGRALKDPDDPWIGQVRRMRAVAVVRRIVARAGSGELAPAERTEAVAAADLLERSLAFPAFRVDGGVLQQQVLAAIIDIDGPGLLDRPQPFRQAKARAEARLKKPSKNPNDPLTRAVQDAIEREAMRKRSGSH